LNFFYRKARTLAMPPGNFAAQAGPPEIYHRQNDDTPYSKKDEEKLIQTQRRQNATRTHRANRNYAEKKEKMNTRMLYAHLLGAHLRTAVLCTGGQEVHPHCFLITKRFVGA